MIMALLLPNILLVIVGLVMLFFGSEWLVRGSVNIARKLRISQLVIGLTIVAFGTSTPELIVSVTAALTGQADISLGNVVGSNIANIGLILGLSAAIFPIAVHMSTIRKEVPIMVAALIALVFLSISDNMITQLEGTIMILALAAFTYFSYTQSRKEERRFRSGPITKFNAMPIDETTSTTASQGDTTVSSQATDVNKKNGSKGGTAAEASAKSIAFIVLGIVILYFGATFTVENSVVIATEIGISERVIGLTIIAIGTSLPELITSIMAAKKKLGDVGIGNIVGSNIFNVLAIVGVSSAVAGISVNPDIFIDYAIMIAFGLVLIPLMRSGLVISRIEGYGLVTAYVIYLAILLILPDLF